MTLTTQDLFESMQWANIAHAKQTRWYMSPEGEVRTEPYANHLLRVCNTVREHHGSIEAQIAAILHDIVEDTPVPLTEVYARYGETVAAYVSQLTLPPLADKNPKLKTKVQSEVMEITKFDEVRLIKIADKYDNVVTLPECRWTDAGKIGYLASASIVVAKAARHVYRSSSVDLLSAKYFTMSKDLMVKHGWEPEFAKAVSNLLEG